MSPRVKLAAGVVATLLAVALAALGAIRAMAPALPGNAAHWLLNDDPDLTDRRLHRQLALIEHAVAACMRDAGLPYQQSIADPLRDLDSQLSPRDWAAEYGFGVSTRLDRPPVVETDPNASYIDTLPTNERDRYVKALFGDASGDPGCRGAAEQEVLEPRQTGIEGHASLFEELAAQIKADQRIVDAEGDWYLCASSAGFPVQRTTRDVVVQLFAERLNQLGDGTGHFDVSGLLELQSDEREAAVAFIDCDTAYAATTQPFVVEITRSWEARHLEKLEALRATLTEIDNELVVMSQQAGLESSN